MPEQFTDFIPALAGWFAYYRQKNSPTGNWNYIIKRPLAGWAIHRSTGTNEITKVVAMTLSSGERDGTLTSINLYHSDTVDLVGLAWPGMTTTEQDLMITVSTPGHITFAPTNRQGQG